MSAVRCWRDVVTLPTYEPQPPDRNPMFLEKRVYQGSSGRVYPLPFYDRIAEEPVERDWEAIWLENEWLQVMVLPELGGRIHVGRDKTNGYDFFYRQSVIKPALVGLAGPWISGGVEFNWPQHHRPATFMPVDTCVVEEPDGSITLWCGDHDPMARMKGMHGVCLHPDSAVIELKVRVHNRTSLTQSFLWWANVGARVHERYQSFFPPDVDYVADHAKRAVSRFPRCEGSYYGVDYAARDRDGVPPDELPAQFVPPGDYPANDLSWYANIPVPTSYMAMGSKEDFFGGYDHSQGAGLLHVCSHHISPGKKQWTWGNHEFGYAWDRNLTDHDGPYIELMAGVYTDNQPDFSFLAPGETKSWSQFWYPYQAIGPAQHANLDAAVSLSDGVGVAVTRALPQAVITISSACRELSRWTADLAPEKPFRAPFEPPKGTQCLRLTVTDASGHEVIRYTPIPRSPRPLPRPAAEPPPPADVGSADELYLIGLHLEQYRHATRSPLPYWREALRRDPLDVRCNQAVALWHLQRGELSDAERHLRRSIERLTQRNPNPRDSEPYYHLGICLREQGRYDEAYDALHKAVWSHAQQAAGYHALAQLDCRRLDWAAALEHVEQALVHDGENLRARNLRAVILRRVGRDPEAEALLAETLALDPLDWLARWLAGEDLHCDTQTRLDLALDFARIGRYAAALRVLDDATPEPVSGTGPLLWYYRGWLRLALGEDPVPDFRAAARASPDHCFPARLEEIAILEAAMEANPDDARAPYYLGNLLYDRRRHDDAIGLWEQVVAAEPGNSVAWRNLGIGYCNVQSKPGKARRAYDRAIAASPDDARLWFERDQLHKRLGVAPATRLRTLERRRDLVARRDDLSVEYAALLNQLGRHEDALAVIEGRRFQPWEGGEGQAMGQHVRTHLALGRRALAASDAGTARDHFEAALASPHNLGEAKHLLANCSDIWYELGRAYQILGELDRAQAWWQRAASFRGDFQQMSVREFSEMTYYSALSLRQLGREDDARARLRELRAYSRRLESTPATIDYFATSLPTMLLFDDDLQERQTTTARLLSAQASLGLGRRAEGLRRLREVLARDPNHALAADLLAEHGS